ncbi:MAG: glutamine cyclotransferase [Verrucomicrobiales bacterium]|nr:glutamine cyclotransferase [Verrucomicrobiales bacterium]
MKLLPAVLLAALTLGLAACGPSASSTNAATPAHSTPGKVPIYTFEIVRRWPHDQDAFTQGLIFHNGGFLESTGLNGKSSLRRVDLASGGVLQQIAIPSQYFAEGIAVVGNRIFQLTWKDQKGFVYDLDTFHLEREFQYQGEGWGLATDGQLLILSDGTSAIRFLDPANTVVKRTIQVTMQGRPVGNLNELEYIKDEIWSNIWGTDYVARIDSKTGNVNSLVDFTNLLTGPERTPQAEVLNGIAYDAATDRLFITGKWWPVIFEVKLKLK